MVEGEVISGTVERLLFEAPDSDYLVFRIRRDDGALLTVTGNGVKPLQGDRLEIRGHGTIHKKSELSLPLLRGSGFYRIRRKVLKTFLPQVLSTVSVRLWLSGLLPLSGRKR